jgi:hypothetical protein
MIDILMFWLRQATSAGSMEQTMRELRETSPTWFFTRGRKRRPLQDAAGTDRMAIGTSRRQFQALVLGEVSVGIRIRGYSWTDPESRLDSASALECLVICGTWRPGRHRPGYARLHRGLLRDTPTQRSVRARKSPPEEAG